MGHADKGLLTVPLTLFVQGTIVSGLLCGYREYLAAFGSTFASYIDDRLGGMDLLAFQIWSLAMRRSKQNQNPRQPIFT